MTSSSKTPASKTPSSKPSSVPSTSKPSAVVVGAGIAGLAAAFALAERGFAVTVYEKEKTAGGNLGATLSIPRRRRAKEMQDVFEVYPHMFGDWYDNFWQLMDAIGKGKSDQETWRTMSEFKFLDKPESLAKCFHPAYQSLRNNGAPLNFLSNLLSGIIPAPDMFLAAYAALGLLADDFIDKDDVNVATLNDFLNTRFYASKYVTQFYQMLILYIWSLDADESSVYACQRFFGYQLRRPTPTAWVLNSGDAYTSIIEPLVHHLQTKLNVKFCFETPVVAASLNQQKNRVEQLLVVDHTSANQKARLLPAQRSNRPPSVYVFAVPPETLSALVQTPIPASQGRRGLATETQVKLTSNPYGIITKVQMASSLGRLPEASPDGHGLAVDDKESPSAGGAGLERAAPADANFPWSGNGPSDSESSLYPAIVEAIPELATTKTFSAEPIPVLYIAFSKEAAINGLIPPDCYIGLKDSNYALTLVEITREFKLANPHLFSPADSIGVAIALAASDFGELPFFQAPPESVDRSHNNVVPARPEAEALEDKTIDMLLDEARKYLPFENRDIEWCFFRSNHNHRLFLNDVESARNPVRPIYQNPVDSRPIVENLAFAGDFCSQDVVMSTVEAAVESGIRAAMLLEGSASTHQPSSNTRLRLKSHSAYPKSWITTSKLLLMPYAVLAKSCSDFNLCLQAVSRSQPDRPIFQQEFMPQLLSYWPRQTAMVLGAYQDALTTMTSLTTQSIIRSSEFAWSLFSRR